MAAGLTDHPWSLEELVTAALAEPEGEAPVAQPLRLPEPAPGASAVPARQTSGGTWLRLVTGADPPPVIPVVPQPPLVVPAPAVAQPGPCTKREASLEGGGGDGARDRQSAHTAREDLLRVVSAPVKGAGSLGGDHARSGLPFIHIRGCIR
jgi:hypothetical protein